MSTDPKSLPAKEIMLHSNLDPRIVSTLQEHLGTITAATYEYPWIGLEDYIESLPGRQILLIGYGSLMNVASANGTIGDESLDARRAVIGMGVRRQFDYLMSPQTLRRYDSEGKPGQWVALNVESTGRAQDLINGVAVSLTAAGVEPLRTRELGYDLVPLASVDWSDPHEAFTAFVLSCPRNRTSGPGRVVHDGNPQPNYYRICRDGAKSISEAFLEFYLNTTFIPSTGQRLSEWERDHPEVLSVDHDIGSRQHSEK